MRPGSASAEPVRRGARGANASASASRSSTSTRFAFTRSCASTRGVSSTVPLAWSDVAPEDAVNRSRFSFPPEREESAESAISRPRLVIVTSRSVMARIETMRTPSSPGGGTSGALRDAGIVNGSGMSIRLFETMTSPSSMRRDSKGRSPVDS
jgi:hypothetical protein